MAEHQDTFRGDDAALVASITALLALDAAGALVPHGVGGHARALLASAAARLTPSTEASAVATQPEGQEAWPQPIATAPKDGTYILIMREGADEAYAARWAEYPGNPVAGADGAEDVCMWGWLLRDRLAYPGGMEDGFLGWEEDLDHMPTHWTRLPGATPVQAGGGKS